MPCNYANYPANWKTEIRPAILRRAGEVRQGKSVVVQARCEQCGAENHSCGYRGVDGAWHDSRHIIDVLERTGQDMFDSDGPLSHCWDGYGNPTRPTRIVLTVSHTDHDTTNNRPDNLRALCQRCHLAHDKALHMANARETRREKTMQIEMQF